MVKSSFIFFFFPIQKDEKENHENLLILEIGDLQKADSNKILKIQFHMIYVLVNFYFNLQTRNSGHINITGENEDLISFEREWEIIIKSVSFRKQKY